MNKFNHIFLMGFVVILHADLAEVTGLSESERYEDDLPKVDHETGEVSNMPDAEENTIYIVNGQVFNALKDIRKDLAMFDDSKVERYESGHDLEGKVKSQGGLIYSKDI